MDGQVKRKGFTRDELLLKASLAATEQARGEVLFLEPHVHFELDEPRGSYECYYYYENWGETVEITVQVLVNGAVMVIDQGEVAVDMN